MLKIVGMILAKLSQGAQRGPKQALLDPLVEKMSTVTWVPTEDDRSAQKYLTDENGGKARAPLAEMMAASYLGRPTEPFD